MGKAAVKMLFQNSFKTGDADKRVFGSRVPYHAPNFFLYRRQNAHAPIVT